MIGRSSTQTTWRGNLPTKGDNWRSWLRLCFAVALRRAWDALGGSARSDLGGTIRMQGNDRLDDVDQAVLRVLPYQRGFEPAQVASDAQVTPSESKRSLAKLVGFGLVEPVDGYRGQRFVRSILTHP